MTHSERMSSVDTTWLRMDRPTNLMMIVAVWLLEGCQSKYLKFFLGTRRILKEALEAPDRFAYSDLAIAPRAKRIRGARALSRHDRRRGSAGAQEARRHHPGDSRGADGLCAIGRGRRVARTSAMLVDGKWTEAWQPVQATDAKGGFVRQASKFRSWVTPDGAAGPTGEAGFRAEKGRYHLYVALTCPWATRVLIARKLKRLEDVVSVSIVEPAMTDQGWRFGDYPGATRDAVNGATYLHEIYTRADPHYTGRATVPALWDKERGMIVNNKSAELLRMFNSGFGPLAEEPPDLYPPALRRSIDALNDEIYASLNNGVYRAGFATTQAAYEEAFAGVFAMLDRLEDRLASGPHLFGELLTEADIRVFVTLARFDAAYVGQFKCNLRRIADYPALSAYLARLIALPAFRDTFSLDHIKRGYYSIKRLNPTGIVPLGPELSWAPPAVLLPLAGEGGA